MDQRRIGTYGPGSCFLLQTDLVSEVSQKSACDTSKEHVRLRVKRKGLTDQPRAKQGPVGKCRGIYRACYARASCSTRFGSLISDYWPASLTPWLFCLRLYVPKKDLSLVVDSDRGFHLEEEQTAAGKRA
jgi:hypothetical protein